MSPTLQEFYNEIHKWIQAGCVDDTFDRSNGLCDNLVDWRDSEDSSRCVDEMQAQFIDAGLHPFYPFNSTRLTYDLEAASNNIFTNPARLNWIKQHATNQF